MHSASRCRCVLVYAVPARLRDVQSSFARTKPLTTFPEGSSIAKSFRNHGTSRRCGHSGCHVCATTAPFLRITTRVTDFCPAISHTHTDVHCFTIPHISPSHTSSLHSPLSAHLIRGRPCLSARADRRTARRPSVCSTGHCHKILVPAQPPPVHCEPHKRGGALG